MVIQFRFRRTNAVSYTHLSEEEIEKYKPKPLEVKVYLDFDKNNYLIADVEFIYGENKINPLDEKQKTDFPRKDVYKRQIQYQLNML